MAIQYIRNVLHRKTFCSLSRQRDVERDQDEWQRDIQAATGLFTGNILNSNIDLSPLFTRLSKCTRRYLKKQGAIPESERDNQLRLLVQLARDKPIAILACATSMTRSSLRSVLAKESNISLHQDSSVVAHLRTIEAVSTVNPYAVDVAEMKKVQSLRQLLDRGKFDFLNNLQAYYKVEGAGSLENLFPPGVVQQLLQGMCSSFRERLELYCSEYDWVSAHSLVQELPALMHSSQAFRTTIMNFLPTWRSWISWQPNIRRIGAWLRIGKAQRKQLKEIFALDGPDFIFESHQTLFEAFMTQSREQGVPTLWADCLMDQIRNIEGDVVQFVYRILQYLSEIRDTPTAIDVFIHFYHRSLIDPVRMLFLERLHAEGKKILFDSVYSILNSPDILTQVREMTVMLETLDGSLNEELLQSLSVILRGIAESGINALQENLSHAFKNRGDPHAAVHQLLRLRQGLENAIILHQMIDDSTLDFLKDLPTLEDSDALLDLRIDAHRFSNGQITFPGLDQYCEARFTRQGTIDKDSRVIAEALLPIWRRPAHAQRKLFALALMSLNKLPLLIRCQCVEQVHKMDENYVRKVHAVIQAASRGAYMACPELLTIISSKGFQRKHEQTCWKELLRWMVEQQGHNLIQGTLDNMTMMTWIYWLEQIQGLLGESLDQPPPPILSPSLHQWSQKLKADHFAALAALDCEAIPATLKQWIFLGQEDSRELVNRMLTGFSRDPKAFSGLLRDFIALNQEIDLTDAPTWELMARLIGGTT